MGSDQQAIRLSWHRRRAPGARRSSTSNAARRSGRSPSEGVDEVLNPTWSPDGARIAFSGLVGGFNDLFVYDLNGAAARLTNNAYAELDPAWSPDGKTAGVQHRTVHDKPAGARWSATCGWRSWTSRRAGSSESAASRRRRTSARSGRGRPLALLHLGSRGHHEHLPAGDLAATPAVDEFPDRRQRHHRAEPGAVGRRTGASSSAPTRTTATTIYALESAQQLAGGDVVTLPIDAAVLPPRTGAGPVYAAISNETLGLPSERPPAAPAEEYKPKLVTRFRRAADGRPSASIRSAPTPLAACRSSSATCSAITRRYLGARSPAASTSSAATSPTSTGRTAGTGARRSTRHHTSRAAIRGCDRRRGGPVYVEKNTGSCRPIAVPGCSRIRSAARNASSSPAASGDRAQAGRDDADVRLQSGQQLLRRQDVSEEPNLNLGQTSAALVYDTSITASRARSAAAGTVSKSRKAAARSSYSGLLATCGPT